MCTTTAVKYNNLEVLIALIKTESQGSSSRFVDNTTDIQTGNFTSFFGGLTLAVVEVSRHGYNCIRNLCTKIILGSFLHLLQDNRRNLLRSIETTVNINTRGVIIAANDFILYTTNLVSESVITLAHETLDRVYCFGRVSNRLTLSRVTYFTLTTVDKTYNRGSSTFTFRVRDDNGFITFHHSYAGISSS